MRRSSCASGTSCASLRTSCADSRLVPMGSRSSPSAAPSPRAALARWWRIAGRTLMAGLPKRRLGDSGREVSVVGLGCNNFGKRPDLDGTAAVLEAALEAGITLFDTADIYGGGDSERLMGEVLEGRRDEYVLATKFGWETSEEGAPDAPGGSREYIRWAIEGSLKRLRVEKVDLYQYHHPDGVTPLEETLGALDELVREGLVGAIGCSNFSAAELEEADRIARERGQARFVTLQNQYSLLERGIDVEMAPACERLGPPLSPSIGGRRA